MRRKVGLVLMTLGGGLGGRRQFSHRCSVLDVMLLVTVVITASNAPKHGMLTTASAADNQEEVTS